MPFYTPIGSTPVPTRPSPANVATTSKETTLPSKEPGVPTPRASSSGSRTSAGQSSTADRSWGDSTLGSSQANAIVLSPSASPTALQGIGSERAASPFHLLNELDKVVDDGRPGHAKGETPSVGNERAGNASSSGSANSPDMPTTQQIIAEHTARSSAATSQRPRASQGPSSSHRSSDTSARRAAQSPATLQRPGAVDHRSQERAAPGSSSSQRHASTTAVPQGLQASDVNSPSSSSSTLTSAQQTSDGSGDGPADASSSSHIHTTRRGDALWTAADEDLLRGIMRRGEMSWKKVHEVFRASSSSPRSLVAMRKHYYKLVRQGQLDRTDQSTVVEQPAAGASGSGTSRAAPSRRRNLWQEDEVEVLRQALAEDKDIKEAICDYALKFPASKRTAMAVDAKYREMLRAAAGAVEEDEDAGEDEDDEQEAEGSDGDASGGAASEDEVDDDADGTAPTTTGAGPKWIPWSEHDDQLLIDTIASNRDSCIHWTKVVPWFNQHSDVERTKAAIDTRWYAFLKNSPLLQQSAQTSSARAGPSTPSVSVAVPSPRKRKRTSASTYPRPRWRSSEMRVLRASLAKHPNEAIVDSYPAIVREFYAALPNSTRSPAALRKKWERLVVNGPSEKEDDADSEESSEAEEDGSEEEAEDGADEDGDATMGDTSAASPGTMQTRSGKTLHPLGEQASQTNSSPTTATRTQTSRDAVVTAVNRQIALQGSSRRPASTAATQQPQGAASSSTAPSISAAPPTTKATQPYPTVSWTPNGVRIENCAAGLDIVIFSRGSGTIYPHDASAALPTFEEPPLFHLRCIDDAGVLPITLPQGVTMRPKYVPKAGGGGEMAMQTSFVGLDDYSVVLVF